MGDFIILVLLVLIMNILIILYLQVVTQEKAKWGVAMGVAFGLALLRMLGVWVIAAYVPSTFNPTLFYGMTWVAIFILARVAVGRKGWHGFNVSFTVLYLLLAPEYLGAFANNLLANRVYLDGTPFYTSLGAVGWILAPVFIAYALARYTGIKKYIILLPGGEEERIQAGVNIIISMVAGLLATTVYIYVYAVTFANVTIMLAGFILMYCGLFLQYSMRKSAIAIREKSMVEGQNVAQQKHLQKIILSQQQIKILTHDYRYNLTQLQTLARAGDIHQLSAALDSLVASIPANVSTGTGNIVLDTIIATKESQANQLGINMVTNLDLQQSSKALHLAVCTLVSNALENAIEAASQASNKYVELEMVEKDGNLMMRLRNTYANTPTLDRNGRLKSTKVDGGNHGLGVLSMQQTAKTYGGKLSYTWDGEYFMLHVILQNS